eukprot:GHUV01032165.1.p1 GENE.GHUV01032165.1~~GHUV01032165.1.p1  ORF type:complete len:126 (-),score=39.30 GHUV01032165.1:349-726(-)
MSSRRHVVSAKTYFKALLQDRQLTRGSASIKALAVAQYELLAPHPALLWHLCAANQQRLLLLQGFNIPSEGMWFWFEGMIDMFFYIDLALNFFTAFEVRLCQPGNPGKPPTALTAENCHRCMQST